MIITTITTTSKTAIAIGANRLDLVAPTTITTITKQEFDWKYSSRANFLESKLIV